MYAGSDSTHIKHGLDMRKCGRSRYVVIGLNKNDRNTLFSTPTLPYDCTLLTHVYALWSWSLWTIVLWYMNECASSTAFFFASSALFLSSSLFSASSSGVKSWPSCSAFAGSASASSLFGAAFASASLGMSVELRCFFETFFLAGFGFSLGLFNSSASFSGGSAFFFVSFSCDFFFLPLDSLNLLSSATYDVCSWFYAKLSECFSGKESLLLSSRCVLLDAPLMSQLVPPPVSHCLHASGLPPPFSHCYPSPRVSVQIPHPLRLASYHCLYLFHLFPGLCPGLGLSLLFFFPPPPSASSVSSA